MPSEPEADLAPEIAHVLLMDVVGYSKLLVDEQIVLLQRLNAIVKSTAHFRAAEAKGKLLRLPTGDGMALLFFDNPEAPLHCALEVGREAKAYPGLVLRMGAHSGPVREVMDVNDRSNVAGGGIDLAQRVLDCGDAGHILLSKRLAEDLTSFRHWHSHLHDLGECEVKHGVRLHLFNLCKEGLGNPAIPQKIRQQRRAVQNWRAAARRWAADSPGRKAALAAGCGLALLAAGALLVLGYKQIARLAGSDPFDLRSSPIAEKSVAVLPFGNLSEEKENAYFTDGVQDEILTGLSKVTDLKVISRTSVMPYKAGPQRNMREIARTLGVAYVLEGNVQRVANRVRVNAQLIDARSDAHVWANGYDRELADVFAIQSEVAQEIVAALQMKLSSREKAAIQARPTTNLEAYDLYVKAKWLMDASHFSPRGKESLLEAAALLRQAVALDPGFFSAYYQLAHAHDQLYYRYEHTPGQLAQAAAAIKTLQTLRPDSAETHLALAKHFYWGYLDYERARKELELAQPALPNDPLPPLLSGYIDRRAGRWEESLKNLHRALELDPRNPFIIQQISLTYFNLRRFPEMGAILDRAVSLAPNNIVTRAQRAAVALEWQADTKPLHALIETFLAEHPAAAAEVAEHWLYLALCERDTTGAARALQLLGADGCFSEGVPFPRAWCEGIIAQIKGDTASARDAFAKALAEAETFVREQPHYGGAICALAMTYAALGKKAEAIREGQRAVELLPMGKDAVDGPLVLGYLAVIYAWTGEKELALEQLEKATAVPSYWSYGNLRLHPYWDPLRGDPRFEEIVASLAPK